MTQRIPELQLRSDRGFQLFLHLPLHVSLLGVCIVRRRDLSEVKRNLYFLYNIEIKVSSTIVDPVYKGFSPDTSYKNVSDGKVE